MTANRTFALLCGIVLLAGACSSSDGGSAEGSGGGTGSAGSGGSTAGGSSGQGTGGTSGSTGGSSLPDIPGTPDAGTGGMVAGCSAAGASEAALEPVRLAFVFDVSASMGQLDKPYHDPKLKWEPVVAATKAFFADPESQGISASLVFFPIDAGDDERCDSASYEKPDVPFTALPSDAFAKAIDDITPHSKDEWRSGTPTLAAIEATLTFAKSEAEKAPGYRYAVVLVSDGYPQGCDDNKIESVAAAVKKAAPDMPTYVIGVSNPEGGPDTVSNLNQIAEAGGTEHAFIIQTGDPEKTKNDFLGVVGAIKAGTVSCTFEIPDPPTGLEFDRTRANVTYDSGTKSTDFGYDPECKGAGAWHYDDESAPARMVLCDDTCAAVRKDPDAKLRVEFGCTRRDVIR